MQFLIIGNPENRRLHLFAEAAAKTGIAKPTMIPYLDLLTRKVNLRDWLSPQTIVRIESPGENFEVEKQILALGAQREEDTQHQFISAAEALLLPYNHGQIRFLRQWYLGYKRLLEELQASIDAQPPKAVMNSPQAIGLLFDKIACQKHLSDHGVDTPTILSGMDGYEALKDYMLNSRYKRVFIKPAHASSASGVIAYRISQNKEEAITSIEVAEENGCVKFYNSLKVRKYTSAKVIKAIIDFIIGERAIIEEWIPKASLQGYIFDVRIVVIDGKARFVLPRLSKTPLTNLHLGNKRGEAVLLQDKVGNTNYAALLAVAEKTVKCLPRVFYAGVDIAIPAGFSRPKVLEVNAFGDLLPNLLINGQDTYSAEITCLLNKIQ
jgi:glutathione synthase/RimK-type ligase-like ATP-grasp enzyme